MTYARTIDRITAFLIISSPVTIPVGTGVAMDTIYPEPLRQDVGVIFKQACTSPRTGFEVFACPIHYGLEGSAYVRGLNHK